MRQTLQYKVYDNTGFWEPPSMSRINTNSAITRRKYVVAIFLVVFLAVFIVWRETTALSGGGGATTGDRVFASFPGHLVRWEVGTPRAARFDISLAPGGILESPTSPSATRWWNVHDVFSKMASEAWRHNLPCVTAVHLGVPISASVLRVSRETINAYGNPSGAIDAAHVSRVLTIPDGCVSDDDDGPPLGLTEDVDFGCVHRETDDEARESGHFGTNREREGGLGGGLAQAVKNDTCVRDTSLYMFVSNLECEPSVDATLLSREQHFSEVSSLCPDVHTTRVRPHHVTCHGSVLMFGGSTPELIFDLVGGDAACAMHTMEVLRDRPLPVCATT